MWCHCHCAVETTTVSGCCTGHIKYNHIGLQNEVLTISLIQKEVDFLPFLGALFWQKWDAQFFGIDTCNGRMQCENHEFCTKFWGKCRNFCAEVKISFSDVHSSADVFVHFSHCPCCLDSTSSLMAFVIITMNVFPSCNQPL